MILSKNLMKTNLEFKKAKELKELSFMASNIVPGKLVMAVSDKE